MKGFPLPLSEEFVYSSPERPAAGSFRWVGRVVPPQDHSKPQREVPHGDRKPH